MNDDLHITLFQQDIVWAAPEANRLRAAEALSDIPSGTDIFVLPETFTTGFGDHMASLAEPADGPTLHWARRQAALHNVLLVGTWIVRVGDRCFNRLHWVLPDGSCGHYDKAHTFRPSGEHEQISCGVERPVFTYKGWRIRPAVCYDLRFPKWLRNDGLAHSLQPSSAAPYDLLLVCANWPASRREAWSTLLKARAIENLCFVAGCNRTGVDGVGGLYSGDSAVIDYKGFAMPSLSAALNRDALDAFRRKWPIYLDFD